MDEQSPLNRNQQLILDFIERNPGCDFKELLRHMHSVNVGWNAWYPDDYVALQRKKLFKRVFTPYPNPAVPELNLGNVTLFPELSVTNTDLKSEPLSDDARVVLAFIRDHPNHTEAEISKELAFDEERVWQAVRGLLSHELIVHHMRVIHRTATMASGVGVYYPK